MTTDFTAHFARQYVSHLKHLKLKGLQPKTIDTYARAIRRLGSYFDYRIDALSEAQLAPTAAQPTHNPKTMKSPIQRLLSSYYTGSAAALEKNRQ